MTKGKLIKLLENIPDDYEVLIDTKKLKTVFADHNNKLVNLSSDAVLQYEYWYNPLLQLIQECVYANKNKQYVNI